MTDCLEKFDHRARNFCDYGYKSSNTCRQSQTRCLNKKTRTHQKNRVNLP